MGVIEDCYLVDSFMCFQWLVHRFTSADLSGDIGLHNINVLSTWIHLLLYDLCKLGENNNFKTSVGAEDCSACNM